MTGIWLFFSNSRSAALFSVWLAIRPSRNTGFFAPAIIFATRSMASSGAAPVCGASLAGSTLAWTGSSTTSCGRLTKALPGRPCSAARNALDTTSASASDAVTSTEYLVTGLNIATVSILWCTCLALSARFTAPPSATTGSPSLLAVAIPVIRLEQPGPEVTSATPAFPVMRPTAAAIKAALASWRTGIMRIEESSSESNTLSIFAPGMPKTWRTPWASSWLTIRSAPCAHWRG